MFIFFAFIFLPYTITFATLQLNGRLGMPKICVKIHKKGFVLIFMKVL